MNDIEVGEYVRTNQGHIGVLKRIEFDKNDKSLKWYVFDKKFENNIIKEEYVNKPYIVKHSKNIIDLIEVGDYVNGEKIIEVRRQKDEIYLMTDYCPQKYITSVIKSIVTHEQFSNIEYKI